MDPERVHYHFYLDPPSPSLARWVFFGKIAMKKTPAISADELASSPMTQIGLKLPRALLDKVDEAAVRDDESCRNRSSIVRRALVQFLRREHRAA